MPRLINDRQKRVLIGVLMHDRDALNVSKAGQTLRALVRVGYLEQTLKKEEGFQGWKITPKGHQYLASMRKP